MMKKVSYIEMDQINRSTGIDVNMWPKYQSLLTHFYMEGMEAVRDQVKALPLKSYSEYFPGAIVCPGNSISVGMLDDLALVANKKLARKTSQPSDLQDVVKRAHRLIYGREIDNSILLETFNEPVQTELKLVYKK